LELAFGDPAELLKHGGADETLTVLEMPIQGALGYSDFLAHILDPEGIDAVLGNDLQGDIQQLFPRAGLSLTTLA